MVSLSISIALGGVLLIGLMLYGPRVLFYLWEHADAAALCRITLVSGFLVMLGLIAYWPSSKGSVSSAEIDYGLAAIQRLSLVVTLGLGCVCAALYWVGDSLRAGLRTE